MRAFLFFLASFCVFNLSAMEKDADEAHQVLLLKAAQEFLRLNEAGMLKNLQEGDPVPEAIQALQKVGLDGLDLFALVLVIGDPEVQEQLREVALPRDEGQE